MPLQIQSPAPTFSGNAYFAPDDEFREISLDDYKEQWLLLYFYPMAFSTVCPTEIETLNAMHDQFTEANCSIVGVSTDSHLVLKAWTHHEQKLSGLKHALLSDITKRISMDYGVLLPQKGIALRGTFIIDPEGTLRWHMVNDLAIGRGTDEMYRVLLALQSEGVCPCNWKKDAAPANA